MKKKVVNDKNNFWIYLAIVLLLILISFVYFKFGMTGNAIYAQGDGSAGNPFVITNCTELQAMNENLTANYVLGNDIDCSDTKNWNDGAGFVPIGNYTGNDPFIFTGSLEGREHIIFNLYINRPQLYPVGLFSFAGSGASIKNFGLENVSIIGETIVGAVLGEVWPDNVTISKVYVTGYVGGEDEIAGLVSILNGFVEDSCFAGKVSSLDFVGGLISSSAQVGSGSRFANISNSAFYGAIETPFPQSTPSKGHLSGGLIGSPWGETYILNSLTEIFNETYPIINIPAIIHISQYPLYMLNTVYYSSNSDPLNCTNLGNFTGCYNISDKQYFSNFSNEPMNSWNSSIWWKNKCNSSTYLSFNFPLVSSNSCPSGMYGLGTTDSPCEITNCTQLQAMNNNLTASYQLMNDIDCSDTKIGIMEVDLNQLDMQIMLLLQKIIRKMFLEDGLLGKMIFHLKVILMDKNIVFLIFL